MRLSLIDFFSISPMIILLLGALVLLFMESFFEKALAKVASLLTIGIFIFALIMEFYAPESTHPLINTWLKFDYLAHAFTALFLLIGIAIVALSDSFFSRFQASQGEYYFLLVSAVFGLLLIGSSADFLTLFLGLETLSIATYVLCGYMKKWELSHEAAIKYFLLGALGAAFLLYGIALIYGATGTTHFYQLLEGYKNLATGTDRLLFLSGAALVTVGLAFKAAVAPFHVWAPDVYDGAPTPVTAFMAVGTKAGAFAAFARIFIDALPHFDLIWNQAASILAIITLIYANFLAMRQTQLRRFFAYSGISHAGFLLIPVIAAGPESLNALLFYLAIYILATLGAFAVLTILDTQSSGVFLNDLTGLFKRAPLLASILSLCLLTLAGIPPTAGFFAKFYILKLAFAQGYILLVVVGLLTTILSAYYYLRIVSTMLSDAPQPIAKPKWLWPAATLAVIIGACIVFFSIFPSELMALNR